VHRAAGDSRVVNDLIYNKVGAPADELGWAEGGVPERIAVTRVINNWVAVHTPEAKANGWPPQARERAAAERTLNMAERRLFQSVKTLALLRAVAVGR
jgi:hypothetical protein